MSTAAVAKSRNDPPSPSEPYVQLLPQARIVRRGRHDFGPATFALVDFVLVCASGFIAYTLRFSPGFSGIVRFAERSSSPAVPLLNEHLAFFLLYAALLLLTAHWQNLYRQYPERASRPESARVLQATGVATLVLTAFIYLSGTKTVSRLFVGLTAVFSSLLLVLWRVCRSHSKKKQFAKGKDCQHALIVGAGKVGQHLAAYLEGNPGFGYKVIGFLDGNHHEDPRILGKMEDLVRVARQEFIDDVFITIPSERDIVKKIATEGEALRLGIKVVPECYDGLAWHSPTEYIGDFPVLLLQRVTIPFFPLFLKRIIDVVGSSLGLVLISPFLLVTAIAIKLDSSGSIFYRASRVGKKSRRFVCYKFRTMVADADQRKRELNHLNERVGPLFKIANDPRVTRLGAILRKYSIDELPQLWNVLKGDMSLVGPRPPEMEEILAYKLDHLRRLEITPGVTGLWQVSARHDPSFETAVALDKHYIENWSLLLDFRILLKTVPVIIRGQGR